MNRLHLLLIVLLVLINLSKASKAQDNEESIRNEINAITSQRHPEVPAGFWEHFGSGVIPILKKMYAESENANEKTFYIDGLAHFSDPSATSFLKEQATLTQNEVMKKKLLSGLIQADGENSFEFVEPYLKDKDAHLRLAVAKGLKNYEQNEKIQKRLAEFRANEKTAWVLSDLSKVDASANKLQKPKKNNEKVHSAEAQKTSTTVANNVMAALPEKAWAGLWRGSYVTEHSIVLADAHLILVDDKTKPMSWKVTFKLPKSAPQEWKTGEFTVQYFQTNRAHWIELRNQKLDIVFLAQRKVK